MKPVRRAVIKALLVGIAGFTLLSVTTGLALDVSALLNEGLKRYERSEFRGALEVWQKGLEWAKRNDHKEAVAVFSGNIGLVHMHLGDYAKALDHYQMALKIDRDVKDRKGEGADLTNIGMVYMHLGDYAKALDHYQMALRIDRDMKDTKGEGADLTNIGMVYMHLGDYAKALDHYQMALKIDRDVKDRKGEGADLTNIGVLYANLGDYQRALDEYGHALRIHRDIKDLKGEGADLTDIGVVHEYLGDYPKALEHYLGALNIYQTIDTPHDERRTAANIGDVQLQQSQFAEAEKWYSRAGDPDARRGRLALVREDYSKARELFAKALKDDEVSMHADFLFADLVGLGLSCEGMKDYTNAKECFQRAVESVENQREALAESQRSRFYEAKVMGFPRIAAYEGLARCLHRLSDHESGFEIAESTKARLFCETLSRKGETGISWLPEGVLKTERELTNRIAGYHKMMEKLFQNRQMERYREVEGDLKKGREELQRFIGKLRKDFPEYAAIKYPIPLKASEVKLRAGEVLFSYQVTDKGVISYLVRDGKVASSEWIEIERKELEEMVRRYLSAFEKVEYESDLKRHDPKLSRKLYDFFLAKALKGVKPDEKLILVPDGILALLPFEALVMNETPLTYVGDSYDIVYAHSATSLTLARSLKKERKGATKDLLVLADPVFSDKDARITGKVQVARRDEYQINKAAAIVKASVGKEETFPRLEATAKGAERLTLLFKGSVDALTGLAASKEALLKRDLELYRYLALLTHGILDNQLPYVKEPALVLSQVNTTDGFLTMTEVMGLKLNCDVAALTACSTGIGKSLSGEGVMHMGRGFQYAGAKSVLMSLWSVEVESTTLLTERFFTYLKEGKDARAALRQARRDVRTQAGGKYDYPYYFAPFVLMGE